MTEYVTPFGHLLDNRRRKTAPREYTRTYRVSRRQMHRTGKNYTKKIHINRIQLSFVPRKWAYVFSDCRRQAARIRANSSLWVIPKGRKHQGHYATVVETYMCSQFITGALTPAHPGVSCGGKTDGDALWINN